MADNITQTARPGVRLWRQTEACRGDGFKSHSGILRVRAHLQRKTGVVITPPKRDDPTLCFGTTYGSSAAKRLRSTSFIIHVSRNETVTIKFSRCGHLFSQIERLLLSARQESGTYGWLGFTLR